MTRLDPTVRIAISVEAFEAIARTLPTGSVGYEAEADAKCQRFIWLEAAMTDGLGVMPGRAKAHSDVIMRITGEAAGREGD